MNWRIIYYALCALVLAGIVHIAIILLIPTYGTRDAYAVISRKMEPFVFRQIAGTGSGTLLSDIDPFFSYGVCRFELSQAGMLMSGPKIDSFWSATVLDEDGTVIYSLNSRTALDRKLDLILLNAVQILRLREAQPVEAETAVIVETDVKAGFVVLRVLTPDESWQEPADNYLKTVSCQPYVPQEVDEDAAAPESS